MAISPFERGPDDEVDLGLLRPPTEFALGLCKRRDEFGRISLSARTATDHRVVLGNPLHSLDQFEHTGADARTQIEEMRSTSRHQHFACEQMRLRQIVDVDIVPYR